MEIWKTVIGYEGVAEVSNMGRVKTLDYKLEVTTRWGSRAVRHIKGRLKRPSKFSNGYMGITFSRNGKCHMVHRLVAAAFLENPEAKEQVNHKNGQRDDNSVGNLEWVTCSENHKHSYDNLPRKKHALIEKTMIVKDGEVLYFDSALDCSRYLNVVPGSIVSAVHRNHKCKGWEVSYVTCKVEC